MKYLLIVIAFVFSIHTNLSWSADPYPFTLKVISEDKELEKIIENKIVKNVLLIDNMEIDNNEDPGNAVSVTLIVYAKKHTNSKINQDHISFTIAHTSKFKFLQLMAEVFKDGSEYNDDIKGIVADLLINKRAVLKRLNNASIDNISGIDTVITTILINLSNRMDSYHRFESVK